VSANEAILDEGWEIKRLRDVADTQLGKTINPREKSGPLQRPYLRNANVQWDRFDLSDVATMHFDDAEASGYRLRPGDLLVCEGGVVGRCAIWTGEIEDCYFQNALHRITPRSPGVTNQWLLENLRWLVESGAITERARGNTILHLSQKELRDLPILVPPTPVQQALTELLKQTRESSDRATKKLEAGRHSIEKFRQSVLTAALAGRLTAEWRSESATIETAAEPPAGIEAGALPTGWTRATVEALAEPGAAVSYGMVKPGPEVHDGVAYVRQQDIAEGTVLIGQLAHTSTEIASKHRKTALREGDVLLCIIRNLRVAVVPPGIDGANITQGMVRIRPGNRVLGEYLAYYLAAPRTQQRMQAQYVGLAMPRINVRDARKLSVDLPPLDEQHEIVNRVKQLFWLAYKLTEHIQCASRHVDQSTQAVLAKAFRGGAISSAT